MTRSSQQPPVSPESRAEPAAESEETAATTAASVPAAGPDSGAAAQEKSGAAVAPRAGRSGAGGTTGPEAAPEPSEPRAAAPEPSEPRAAAPEPGTTPGTTSGTTPGARPESGPDATAAAHSRLPALVRTMTATAIDRPKQDAGPVGRPGRAVLAGAAVAGALLVSVPFLVLTGNDDRGPGQPSSAAAGTVLDGSAQEAPGEFAVTAPETEAAGDGEKKDADKPEKPEQPVRHVPPPAAPSDSGKDAPQKDDTPEAPAKKADGPKEEPKRAAGGATTSGEAENQPAKAGPAVTFSGFVSFRSHLSGRCIDVPSHNFSDGKPLFVWDCNNSEAQRWRFASDGTIRIKDKCLDVANANFNDGTPIQIAWCNGSAAQKFALNGAHDLVNTVVGKCVDIKDQRRDRGAWLVLWTCTGLDNQKWSA